MAPWVSSFLSFLGLVAKPAASAPPAPPAPAAAPAAGSSTSRAAVPLSPAASPAVPLAPVVPAPAAPAVRAATAPDQQPATPAALTPVATTAATPRAPLTGLGNMGEEAWCATASGTPDNSLPEPNAHPGIYSFAVAQFRHCDLVNAAGSFNKAPVEAAKGALAAYNAANPSKPMLLKVRVMFAAFTAPSLMDAVGSVMLYPKAATTAGSPSVRLPLHWTPAYQAAMLGFWTDFAGAYDGDPLIGEVAISAFSSSTAEPMILDGSPLNTPLLIAAGYTDAAFQANLNSIPAVMGAWKLTPLDLTLNPLRQLQKPGAAASCDFAIALGTAARAAFGARLTLANHGITSPLNPAAKPLLDWMKSAGGSICFQTDSPTDSMAACIPLGVSLGATAFECWNTRAVKGGPLDASADVVEGWAAMLNG